jgi:glycosyltransferase involved in cell wall biosynthesis
MHAEAVIGARIARRPCLARVAGDPAWERGRRQGLIHEEFDAFQESTGGSVSLRAMRRLRTFAVRSASAVIVPSEYLARVVDGWIGRRGATVVVSSGVAAPTTHEVDPSAPPPLRIVYVGRLVVHKRVDLLIHAIAQLDAVELDVIGDGPDRERLQGAVRARGCIDRVRFLGSMDHGTVMSLWGRYHCLVTIASYEGLPHTAIEALASGVPVVASAAGGTPEAVQDGVNGLLVDPATSDTVEAALARLRDDPDLLDQLRTGAQASASELSLPRMIDRLESELGNVAFPKDQRPPVVFVGKTDLGWPLSDDLSTKYDLVGRHVDGLVFATGRGIRHRTGGTAFVLFPPLRPALLGGVLFYTLAPALAVATAARSRAPIVCQSPFEALGALLFRRLVPRRRRPAVMVEVHGDWRTAARYYGSAARRPLAPLADRAAEWALRRADRVRAVGETMAALVRDAGFTGELDVHVTYSDFSLFLDTRPASLPPRPQAAFVAALQPYKLPNVLLEAWAEVHKRFPEATLAIAGDGPMRSALQRQADAAGLHTSVRFLGQQSRPQVAHLLDESWFLVLPSVSEGLPRIALESLARGRPVVGTTAGGIPELVRDGENGLLVAPFDAEGLALAIEQLLSAPDLVAQFGAKGRALAEARNPVEEYEAGVRRLAEWARRRRNGQ